MKIAVKNSDGVQNTEKGRLRYYYDVEDNYDFSGNSATDVTDVSNLGLFYSVGRYCYVKYIESLSVYADNTIFSGLTLNDKTILAKNFVVDKDKRDEVLTQQQQDDSNYFKLYNFLSHDVMERLGYINRQTTPKSIDYKRDVKKRFSPKYEFSDAGFLTGVTYYENLTVTVVSGITTFNYDNPIVRYDAQYFENSDGYVTHRIIDRSWAMMDDTWSPDHKVSLKLYDSKMSREEGNRRRRNLINNLLIDTVGLFFMTSGDATVSETESHAIPFLTEIDSGIQLYYESGAKEDAQGNPCLLIQQVSASTYTRLGNAVPNGGGATIKDFIISRLNPQ